MNTQTYYNPIGYLILTIILIYLFNSIFAILWQNGFFPNRNVYWLSMMCTIFIIFFFFFNALVIPIPLY